MKKLNDSQLKYLESYLVNRICSKSHSHTYLLALHQYKIIDDDQYINLETKIESMEDLKD